MKVADILAHKGNRVVTIKSDASLRTAIKRLALERIGALVVSDDGEHVDGVLSERDVVMALAEQGGEILEPSRRVEEFMTRSVRVCTPEDSIAHLMRVMTLHRIRHLPVVEDGRLVGIVSIGDVVKNRLEELEMETSVLRDAWLSTH